MNKKNVFNAIVAVFAIILATFLGAFTAQAQTYYNQGYNQNYNDFSLATTNITVGLNQSISIPIYNSANNNLRLASASNNSIATVAVYNDHLGVLGLSVGHTTVTICDQYSNHCVYADINVQPIYNSNNSNNYPQYPSCNNYPYNNCGVSLEKGSVSLVLGQSDSVRINGSGSYYISGNNNPKAVSASISGNSVNLYANSAGSATITICSYYPYNGGSQCANLSVGVSKPVTYYNNYQNYPYYQNYPNYQSYPTYQNIQTYPVYQQAQPILYYISYYPVTTYYPLYQLR